MSSQLATANPPIVNIIHRTYKVVGTRTSNELPLVLISQANMILFMCDPILSISLLIRVQVNPSGFLSSRMGLG
jgi:hypothetical protein